MDSSSDTGMTKRQWEVLHQMAEGKSNEEIAEALGISVKTVDTHVGSIYATLGVKNWRQFLRWCLVNATLLSVSGKG